MIPWWTMVGFVRLIQSVQRYVAGTSGRSSLVRLIIAIVVPFGWVVLLTSPAGLATIKRLRVAFHSLLTARPASATMRRETGQTIALVETSTAA